MTTTTAKAKHETVEIEALGYLWKVTDARRYDASIYSAFQTIAYAVPHDLATGEKVTELKIGRVTRTSPYGFIFEISAKFPTARDPEARWFASASGSHSAGDLTDAAREQVEKALAPAVGEFLRPLTREEMLAQYVARIEYAAHDMRAALEKYTGYGSVPRENPLSTENRTQAEREAIRAAALRAIEELKSELEGAL